MRVRVGGQDGEEVIVLRRPVKRMDLALRYYDRKARGECVACSTDEEPVAAIPGRVHCNECQVANKAKVTAWAERRAPLKGGLGTDE